MFKSLKILNFQSHEKTNLSFHEGVNVIVGSSDSGKSTIIRSLRWLIWNRPSGNSFRSIWGGATTVLLETKEGFIRRSKDKKDKYELKKQDNWGSSFEAFGTNVPDEITAFLNINEINLQQQLESPFLLSKSSGEVAQHFNKVANLDKITKSQQSVQKEIRDLEQTIKFKTQQRSELKTELGSYNHLEQFETELEVLEQMEQRLRSLHKTKGRIEELLEDYENCVKEEGELKELLSIEKPVLKLLQLYKERQSLESTQMRLSKALNKFNNTVTLLTKAKAAHVRLSSEFQSKFPNVCPLCGKPK